ncbi:MAG: hypothetical protein Q4G40_09230 [Brachybacterium sp.]|nr:hypothetical protein [Brachybacterium sp.]
MSDFIPELDDDEAEAIGDDAGEIDGVHPDGDYAPEHYRTLDEPIEDEPADEEGEVA